MSDEVKIIVLHYLSASIGLAVSFTLSAMMCFVVVRLIHISILYISRSDRFRMYMHRRFGWEYVSFDVGYGNGRRTERLKHDKKGRAYVRYRNRKNRIFKGYVLDRDIRNVKLVLGKT